MGGAERTAKQRLPGRLPTREGLVELLDFGSFEEIGVLARSQLPDLSDRATVDGTIVGSGRINGRGVFVNADDPDRAGRHAWPRCRGQAWPCARNRHTRGKALHHAERGRCSAHPGGARGAIRRPHRTARNPRPDSCHAGTGARLRCARLHASIRSAAGRAAVRYREQARPAADAARSQRRVAGLPAVRRSRRRNRPGSRPEARGACGRGCRDKR